MHHRLFLIAALVSVSFAGPLCADNAQEAYKLGVKANQLQSEKRHADALKLVRRAIQLDPKNPYYHGLAGSVSWHLKQFNDGLRECEAALALANGKEDAWFLHMAGENAYGTQDFPKAKRYFQRAIARGDKALAGNFPIAQQRLAALSDKTYEFEWILEPAKATPFKRKDGTFLIPLPASNVPFQKVDKVAVTGALAHKFENFEGNEAMSVRPRGTASIRIQFRVTLRPYTYKDALAKRNTQARVPAEATKYLQKSEWIDPKSPMLLAIVQPLRRDDPVEIVENILAWLRKRLTYVPGSTFTSAEDILKQRKAICHGWAAAFTALCRTAGVPARMVDVLDSNQFHDSFEFHTYGEFYVPGAGWIPVEPQPNGIIGIPNPGQIRLYHYSTGRKWNGRNANEIHPLCTLKQLGVLQPKYKLVRK